METVITIFGATGNLMYKKLIPALSALLKQGYFPDNLRIICIARTDCTLSDYIKDAKQNVSPDVEWDDLIPYLKYMKMDINIHEDYLRLKALINTNSCNPDSMFYLAVPPQLFPVISKGISDAKLIEKGMKNKRIVFEKPFGENLTTAQSINKKLWNYFDESQIYRIDHYLGKEMIQNILVIRFANKIFENSWNHETIKSVKIIAKETEGVMQRGNYYDKIGALKDMIQSHLMQMAALIAMEEPDSFDALNIQTEKVKIMKKIKIEPSDILLGQYDGYKSEDFISANSQTETFVYLKAFIDTPRWEGVPFYFITGKKLDEKRSEIIVEFKENSQRSKYLTDTTVKNNKLIIKVAPTEGVFFQINVKEPGLHNKITSVNLDYCHTCNSIEDSPEAYEKLLLDLINKDATLFTRWDEIETSWEVIDKIKEKLDNPLVYKDYSHLTELINQLTRSEFNDL